jgi:response regulator RpfG family c-di-GMP phosphodiesterase
MLRDKVIFVDDEKICHIFADIVLSNHLNYTLISAYNGKEAIKLINLHLENIALVISDILLPDLSGYEIFDYLIAKNQQHEIGFLLQTGLGVHEISNGKQYESHNIPVLHKPYSHKELISAVSQTLATMEMVK